MNIKKKIHDDIWDIIEGNEIEKLNDKEWIVIAFSLLLEGDKFLVENAMTLAKMLKQEYDKMLNGVEQNILNGNGEVLPVLEGIQNHYDERIQSILDKIKLKIKKVRIKNGNRR